MIKKSSSEAKDAVSVVIKQCSQCVVIKLWQKAMNLGMLARGTAPPCLLLIH